MFKIAQPLPAVGRWNGAIKRKRMKTDGSRTRLYVAALLLVAAVVAAVLAIAGNSDASARPSSSAPAPVAVPGSNLLVYAVNKKVSDFLTNEDLSTPETAYANLNRLSANVRDRLFETMKVTSAGTRMNLIVALSYSSRWEISEACRRIAIAVREGTLNAGDISEPTVRANLATADIPDPELMIRTSGEKRLSNFLLWQLAYAELYFTEKLWPDFGKEDFYKAVADFQKRERRYGKTSEQITENR